jgi:Holliday junction resolvase RusA-like endonuclease
VDQPPESGSLSFSLPFGPVSLQATSARKTAAQNNFRKHLPSTHFLLSGDVSLEIEWLIHESARYESDTAPDVDNIVKPLMDVLCGPNGILIDDNQVQSITCSWIDWTSTDEQLNFRIRFSPDEFVSKDGLIFVEFANSLCMPLNRNAPPQFLLELLNHLKESFDTRLKLQKAGMNYYTARTAMSVQRVFHRSRVSRFEVVRLETILKDPQELLRRKGPH